MEKLSETAKLISNLNVSESTKSKLKSMEELLKAIVEYPVKWNLHEIPKPDSKIKCIQVNYGDDNAYREEILTIMGALIEADSGCYINFVTLVIRYLSLLEFWEYEINALRAIVDEQRSNLDGSNLFVDEYLDEWGSDLTFNSYAEIIRQELETHIESLQKKIPKGQGPKKAELKYRALAYVDKTIEEKFLRRNKSDACGFLMISNSAFSEWHKGTDKFEKKNEEKYDEWFKNTPKSIINALEPEIRKFFIDPTYTYKKINKKISGFPDLKGII